MDTLEFARSLRLKAHEVNEQARDTSATLHMAADAIEYALALPVAKRGGWSVIALLSPPKLVGFVPASAEDGEYEASEKKLWAELEYQTTVRVLFFNEGEEI